MNPNASAPAPVEIKKLTPQRGIFDLNTMEDVTCYKVIDFTEVTTAEEALARLGNDSERFLEVINRGLRAELSNDATANPELPWMIKDENGNFLPFEGTAADQTTVNNLILTMAKGMFGYSKDITLDARKAAKQSAMDIIKNTPAIRENLKKQAQAALAKPEGE